MAIQLPNGVRFSPEGWTWSLAAHTITFTNSSGATFTYDDPNNNAVNAAFVMQQIDVYLADKRNSIAAIPATPLAITSISPTSFDITTDTLTINGSGFQPGAVGRLHFEDAAGGQDSNDNYMVCTYVSSTKLTAVYGGAGGGVLGTPAIIYYQDANGNTSNNIAASNPSGTNVTIP